MGGISKKCQTYQDTQTFLFIYCKFYNFIVCNLFLTL
jgi:hypothetical protein